MDELLECALSELDDNPFCQQLEQLDSSSLQIRDVAKRVRNFICVEHFVGDYSSITYIDIILLW